MFVAFFLAAIVGGVLTSRSRENEAALMLRERRMVLLYGFTRALTAARGLESVASLGETFFLEHLGAGVAHLPDHEAQPGQVEQGDHGQIAQVSHGVSLTPTVGPGSAPASRARRRGDDVPPGPSGPARCSLVRPPRPAAGDLGVSDPRVVRLT